MKKVTKVILILAVTLIGAGFYFSSTVKAATGVDLQVQIQAIMAQIASLQTQLAQLQGQQNQGWCHAFNSNLGFINSGNNDVSALHTALQKEGISYGSDDSATYAEDTAAAVVQFQVKYGIRQTGYVGPVTRAKLNILYGCTQASPSAIVFSPNGGETINANQSYLVKTKSSISGFPVVYYLKDLRTGQQVSIQSVQFNLSGEYNFYFDFSSNLVNFVSGDQYKIQIYSNGSLLDESDAPFTINSSNLTNQPSITVISPNGGETLTRGRSFDIQWKSQNLPATDNVDIYLSAASRADFSYVRLYKIATVSAGSYRTSYSYPWSIPTELQPSIIPNAIYEIEIVDSSLSNVRDVSDNYFNIVSPTVSPTVGIASPNTGETWQLGSTYSIMWFADKFNVSEKVNIVLIDSRGGESYYVIARDIPAYNNSPLGAGTPMGSYSWTIPTGATTPGTTNSFKIYVGKYSPLNQTGDWSSVKSLAENGIYGYGNSFNITSQGAKPIITAISAGGAQSLSATVSQGQSTVIGLYGYNFAGVSGSLCGVNAAALDGITVTSCNPSPLTIGLVVNVNQNASPGDRQLTVTTSNGISNAVTLTVLSSSTNKNITLTSPNGGENWKFGETHRITWTSQGLNTVAIYIYNDTISGSGSTNYLDSAGTSLSVPASQGYFDWTIVQNWLPHPAPGNENKYKISIGDINASATGIRATSNYFSITAP